MPNQIILPRRAVLAGAAASVGGLRRARAQEKPIRIGILTDLSGPYRDNGGLTSVACARQAVQDLGLAERGIKVEIVSADHQNKADIGLNIARSWFDRDAVDAVAEVNNSSIALAINGLVTEKNKVFLCSGAGSVDLTGTRCSPNMVQWQSDTWNDAQIADAVIRNGGDKWFFIASDYTSGRLLQQYTAQAVEAGGGKVVGSVFYPFPDTTDFSSFLLRAQASGVGVVHYVKAITALGVGRAKASALDVVKTMKGMPTDDDCFGKTSIRADGRVLQPLYLFQVKPPAESNGPWDLYKMVDRISPDRAFRPQTEGGCKLTAEFQPSST
jgi:ABC-type branched-subunit amino acid transport system substrate-binding protein